MNQHQLDNDQEKSVAWLRTHPRSILAHDPGIGKTPITIRAVQEAPSVLVIVCLRPAIDTWVEQVPVWSEGRWSTFVYSGPKRREVITRVDRSTNFVITTPGLAPELADLPWDTIIIDEAHYLRNRNTQAFRGIAGSKKLKPLHSRAMYLLTGTPQVNGVWDLWALLHLLDPKKFKSYWRFVEAFSYKVKSEGGIERVGVKNAPYLRKMLKDYMIRLTKGESTFEFVQKKRIKIEVEMQPGQRHAYEQMAKTMMLDLKDGGLLTAPSILAKLTRMRQLSIAPSLLHASGRSAMIDELVARTSIDFSEEDEKSILVLCPFVEAFTAIKEALAVTSAKIWTLDGSMTQTQLRTTIEQFNSDKAPYKILIASVQLASSWSAPYATVANFIGYHWTPTTNLQAEDRIHRRTSTRDVEIRYYVSKESIDEHILDIVTQKKTWAELSIRPSELFQVKEAV